MLEKSIQVTHLASVALSELELISIDGGVGARDEWRREDNFPFTDPAILRMRLVSDGPSLSLDMMIVKRKSQFNEVVQVCSSHGKPFLLNLWIYVQQANLLPITKTHVSVVPSSVKSQSHIQKSTSDAIWQSWQSSLTVSWLAQHSDKFKLKESSSFKLQAPFLTLKIWPSSRSFAHFLVSPLKFSNFLWWVWYIGPYDILNRN